MAATTDDLRMPPGPKQLAFEFTGLSCVAPGQIRYRYRLAGFDDEWNDAGTSRRASYTGLGPGRYTFRVEAGATGGEWGVHAGSLTFTIPPFVWQTWWFRAVVAATVITVLAAAYRYRVSHLLAVERLRLRIASDLHDSVGSNLSSIALLSEMLRERTGSAGLERRQLERITSAARETIGSLREIIWLVDPEHDNAADLVTRMRATANDLVQDVDLRFAAGDIGRRRLEPLFVRHVFLLYKEALHNVTRHAGASRVAIEVGVDGDQLGLRVEDDGVGFDVTGSTGGHGLNSMRRRAADAGGTLEIDSAPGRGTRVMFVARIA
jgi:signal transduction histidine kinase